jgi:biotin transport system substrate-specific component
MAAAAPIQAPSVQGPTTFADLVWPARPGRATVVVRGIILTLLGACILTLSAKITVQGPINMTLQTLAVLALGATLGLRLSVASVALYVAEGAMGLPVFTNTPPLVAGLPYLMGPTGGFLAGFALAAAMVGFAADRGLINRPLRFAILLVTADLTLMACGWTWLALFAQLANGAAGLGFAKAFALGVQPFLLAETVKVALAAFALPVVWAAATRLLQR